MLQLDLAIGKACAKCGTWRLFSEYAIQHGKPHSYCKPCKRAYDKARYRTDPEHRQRTIDRANAWQAANYERAERKWKAWRVANRDRKNENERKRRLKNPEHEKERSLLQVGKRRARLRDNGVFYVSTKEARAIRSRPCFACGGTEDIAIDHIIPIARGGRHSIGNLMPLCVRCNVSKGKMTWFEWKHSDRPRAVEVFRGRT
jgi:5-methylcytosine-specific restriction endonuclease McrA